MKLLPYTPLSGHEIALLRYWLTYNAAWLRRREGK